jgi:hypothetical protein
MSGLLAAATFSSATERVNANTMDFMPERKNILKGLPSLLWQILIKEVDKRLPSAFL